MPRKLLLVILVTCLAALATSRLSAFCGFYVAKADADLFNQASQVVLVRDGERTVLTMSNDYQGDLKEFAIVVPVPVVLTEGQIHVGDKVIVDRLDAFSAPRLVEYFDPDPCAPVYPQETGMMKMSADAPSASSARLERAKSLGVTIEASYTVGEYDILILSAKESDGLEKWLVESGYKLPKGASAALAPYIRQGLKFFVAKVNLAEQAKTGFSYLRPLQMAYESPRFMLPIRLGMLNSRGSQDLLIYALTRHGRVECSNYRTVRIPSDVNIPPYVKDDFAHFYRDMFAAASKKEGAVAFLEYFWDMGWCDPCAADPLSHEELRKAGVFWLDEREGGGAGAVLITRLHVRYDAAGFPEDLTFRETEDRENFQGRYILQQPFKGNVDCAQGEAYRKSLAERQEKEAQTLASLTGWDIAEIRRNAGIVPKVTAPKDAWWDRIFK
jgi:hypothetical protein